jgi:GTP-binding protein Era
VIVGLPNVGKSTLLNRLVGRRLVAVSPKPQTTRNRILGIHRGPDVEICFVDTPGIQHGKGALRRFMRDEALAAAADGDVTLLVIDASERKAAHPAPPGRARRRRAAGGDHRRAVDRRAQQGRPGQQARALAADRGVGGVGRRARQRPRGGADRGQHRRQRRSPGRDDRAAAAAVAADVPPDIPIAPSRSWPELIREQLFHQLGQELPYSAAVVVERFEDHDSGALSIGAYIAVERESQKAIVIGRGGQRIKELGVAARVALGELFGCAVHLSLLVKIAPAWTTADAAIRRFGYRGDS